MATVLLFGVAGLWMVVFLNMLMDGDCPAPPEEPK